MYRFTFDAEHNEIQATRITPHPETECWYIREGDDGNSGGNGPSDDVALPADAVSGYQIFEYRDGATGPWYDATYYQVQVPALVLEARGGPLATHVSLGNLRHRMWGGATRAQAELDYEEETERLVQEAIDREQYRRDRAARQARMDAEEQQVRDEVAIAQEARGDRQRRIVEALRERFPDYAG